MLLEGAGQCPAKRGVFASESTGHLGKSWKVIIFAHVTLQKHSFKTRKMVDMYSFGICLYRTIDYMVIGFLEWFYSILILLMFCTCTKSFEIV